MIAITYIQCHLGRTFYLNEPLRLATEQSQVDENVLTASIYCSIFDSFPERERVGTWLDRISKFGLKFEARHLR